MRYVEPQVFLVAQTVFNHGGFEDYMRSIGHCEYLHGMDTCSDAENLIEAGGRMCYRSWAPYDEENQEGTNVNVGKVRKGNKNYVGNIIKQKHGSVMEHANATFIFKDVSRVFTHELVRHRAGCAFSQESLRYVRLTDIPFWMPESVRENSALVEAAGQVLRGLEQFQQRLAEMTNIDAADGVPFAVKKKLTSMFRRFAPIGLSTTIMVTMNMRALRHIIAMRTSPGAEEEIRLVFDKVAAIAKKEWPNIFQDMERHPNGEWMFTNEKV